MQRFVLIFICLACARITAAQFSWQLKSLGDQREEQPMQFFTRDSIVYTVCAKGLQIFNRNTKQSKIHFAGYFPLKNIAPDTGGYLIFLKDTSKYIAKYNHSVSRYENIADSSFQSRSNITQIDVSNNSVWAIADSSIAVYKGHNWQWFDLNNGAVIWRLKAVNDSLAFLGDSKSNIYKVLNGQLSFVYHCNSFWGIRDMAVVPGTQKLWVANSDSLILIDGNLITTYGQNNTIGVNSYREIAVKANNHLVVMGDFKVYEYDGVNWSALPLPQNQLFYYLDIDERDSVMVVARNQYSGPYNHNMYVLAGSSINTYSLKFSEFSKAQALAIKNDNLTKIVTPEGLFEFEILQNGFNFIDTTALDYVNDITCFTVQGSTNCCQNLVGFGTHHGVRGINIDNSMLPDSNINYLMWYDSTYYIGTDKGLCIYNNSGYAILDTSNSPLPSQKITCMEFDYRQRLIIGTDQGIAIRSNGQWQVFDTSNVAINNFYVTAVLPYNNIQGSSYGDNVWITTMGNGLVIANYDGTSQVFNTGNNLLEDDSLYYVKDLVMCPPLRVIGSKSHGIIYLTSGNNPSFNYYKLYDQFGGTDSITQSTLISGSGEYANAYLFTDAGLILGGMCEGLHNIEGETVQLKWFTTKSTLSVLVPDGFTGKANLNITDVLGRLLVVGEKDLVPGTNINMDVNGLPSGFYVLSLQTAAKQGNAKIIVK
jgi:hypothetical protein